MKKLLMFSVIGCWLLACPDIFALSFYVAANGSDAAPGTKSHPFATLERARDEIRRLKKTETMPREGATVFVGAGTYRLSNSLVLDDQDSGTSSAPIIWQAGKIGKVRLSGGTRLPNNSFQPVKAEEILARLDPTAREKVLAIDLHALGIRDLGSFPSIYRGAPAVPELFFNDERLRLARWPNEGWATIAKVIKRGAYGLPQESTNQSSGPGSFQYEGIRPDRWNLKTGVWLQGYFCFDWYDETIKVGKIDRDRHEITLDKPARYGVGFGNPSPRRYRAINVLEELDQPGEYYIDRDSGYLYLWPPGELAGARIELSVCRAPLVVIRNASNIIFRGFVFEEGVGDSVLVGNSYFAGAPANQTNSALASAKLTSFFTDSTSDRVILQAGGGAGILVNGGNQVRIEACEIRNMRQMGIRITCSSNCAVVSCNIHDTGTGGLVLDGGDRKTLSPGGNEAINNRLWKCSENQLTYGSSLTLAGVGNRAAHNEFFDAPHMAIGIVGNDNIFEFNYVHDVCTASDDSGALYKGRDPSCRGNIIRDNFWKDIGSAMGHGTAAIYFDDGDGGDTVAGNIFLRCGSPGRGQFGTIFSHGGHGILAENNIFIESKRALGSVPWDDSKWKQSLAGSTWQKRLLRDVDITKSPYTTHYPELAGFMDAQPEQTRLNQSRNNLFVKCGEVSGGNWTNAPGEIWATNGDPGFVNLEKGDLRLRRDALVYRHLPNFKPIPFEIIGVQRAAEPPGATR
jgi:hypothetical protein